MNVDKERKAFEEWCQREYLFTPEFNNKRNIYKVAREHSMWLAWQASANREGYKLVPVEPTKTMQQAAFDVYEVCNYKSYGLNSGTGVRDMIYKAMIGACDE